MLKSSIVRSFAEKASKIIENELYNNPHFERAFPHLAKKLDEVKVTGSEPSWGDSLFYKGKGRPLKEHDAIHEDEKNFYEGYRAPAGPLKWMSKEEKERIHNQIDYKMDQLEKTGLSREEILYNKPGGLSLSEDPVFQYLRYNRDAREMMVKPGEEFTVQKVIDYALRQDTGIDRSRAALPKDEIYEHEVPDSYDYEVAAGKLYPNKIQPYDYYYKHGWKSKVGTYNRYFRYGGQMYPEPVWTRDRTRRRNMREVNLDDIDYKNTEFLAQFMTPAGLIKNRWQTRLKAKTQRRVARAIKHARNLNLFPFTGYILPPHKMNLVPIHMQNYNNMVIHSETGTVFSKKYEAEVTRLNEIEYPNTIEKAAQRFKFDSTEDDIVNTMKKFSELIDVDIQWIPSKQQVRILEAQEYLKTKQGEGQKMLEELKQKIKVPSSFDIASIFVKEKAASVELLQEKPTEEPPRKNVLNLWEEINEIKKSVGIEPSHPKWVEELVSPTPIQPI
ncbi:unnamed protein product [Blepharisma stoltei]|uniref:Ribosomal protein S18 n=1 Tax=Blepharisma stoltei TaxID=1481888 RepID=A0AAU9I9G5_9CILI|nr:unnamed protein product [Blepharisma stoltei]